MSRLVAILLLLIMCAPTQSAQLLYLEDRDLLAELEAAGFGFEDVFDSADAGDLAALHGKSGQYRSVVGTIEKDLAQIRQEIEAGGRPLREFTSSETGRIMDMRWLTSEVSRFRLVGIVNRLDRRDFHLLRGEASCGEVRFVYRLAYAFRRQGRGKLLSSRLPFNFNAVFDIPAEPGGGCSAAARRWEIPADRPVNAQWVAAGPLASGSLRLRQIELNAQVVRFPSGQEPEFGGQAVYLMRIFAPESGGIVPIPLENTPDFERISTDNALKSALVDYVRANSAHVDEGVYMLPEQFLARRLVSYSTFGAARPINNPFAGILDEKDFADLDLDGNRVARTPAALIARLDNGTCQGCHQAGSTAGFHVIGLDDADTSPLNRILVGISPHLHAELPRRAAYAEAVIAGREPNGFRPLSFAPPADWRSGQPVHEPAGAAMACIAPDDPRGLPVGWECEAGTRCTMLAASAGTGLALAQCLVSDDDAMFSGHPCLAGEVSAGPAMPFDDRYGLRQFAAFAQKASARDYTCRPPRIGVPGGMAYRQCDERDRSFAGFAGGGKPPREICGLTGGKKFDICVATGNFDQCLAGATQRGNRATCSRDVFCRDDYICQAFPPDTPNAAKVADFGFCSPTYFMFQMRIDNHTTPWARETVHASARGGGEGALLYRSVEAEPGTDPDDLW